MYCPNCGAGLPDDARFCAVCGTSIVQPPETDAGSSKSIHEESFSARAAEPYAAVQGTPVSDTSIPTSAGVSANSNTPSAPKNGSNILLIAGIVLGLIVLVIVAFAVVRNFVPSASGSGFVYTKTPLIIEGEDEVQIYNGGSKPVTIDGSLTGSVFSMDGKKIAILADQDEDGTSTLYYIEGTKVQEVSQDVYVFDISANGNVVGYITDYDQEDNTGTLNIYDSSTGKSREAADDVYYNILLSPDGKSYAYTSDIETDDYGTLVDSTWYISVNGKEAESMDSDMQVIGLSNSANYVYYVETNTDGNTECKLYVRHGKTDTKIGTADTNYYAIFNRDYSEILYKSHDKTYLSRAAGSEEKIAGFPVYMLAPDSTQIVYTHSVLSAGVYNVTSLTGHAYFGYDSDSSSNEMTIGYLDSTAKFTETDTVDYDAYGMRDLAADTKGFYFLDDSGEIRYYKDVTNPETKADKIEGDDDIVSFVVSPDQSTVYFVDENETLWVKHGNDDPVEVADDVLWDRIHFSADGKGLYYIADYSANNDNSIREGTLCYISNARNAKVSELAEDVSSVEVSDFGIVYYIFDKMTDDGYYQIGEAFYSRDGKNFKSVMDDAHFW